MFTFILKAMYYGVFGTTCCFTMVYCDFGTKFAKMGPLGNDSFKCEEGKSMRLTLQENSPWI